MLTRKFRILLITLSLFYTTNGEDQLETVCNINGKKALQYVSEKFLSISIDPAVILAGLNLSEASLRLAQHLSPAYIRIAGPSTKFVKYVDNEDKFDDRLSDDGSNVVVTPSMWFGINEWLSLANLTPVFGINDVETTRGVWNPKSTLPLLEISDKLNISCYWQLGFDTSQKDELQYKQDLNIFSHLLAAFPERNESWKIVGSDISNIQQDYVENVMTELQDIVTAVMWEPQEVTENSFPEKDMGWKILHQQHKLPVKVWTTIPKAEEPVSFSSALLWAIQIGEAAKAGYDVVFRQPRLHEMFSDTPAYWFSLLHKKLMGSNVLEAKTTASHPGSSVYAHCTRKQNSFVRRGAMTVMVVNRNMVNYKVKVKLGSSANEKTIEVLSYVLTSTGENSTDVFLNGEQLTPDQLSDRNAFEPKLRRAKLKSHVSLEVPPLSIGFFVLPGARVPVCINEEKEMDLLLEEIAEDQNIPLSEELVFKLSTRGSFANNPTLEEIAQKMKKELQSDEKFYNADHALNFKLNALSQRMQDPPIDNNVNQRGRKFFIEKAKLAERQKKRNDMERRREELKEFLSEKAKTSDSYKPKIVSKSKHLELTSKEVENILKDRARARAAQRNIFFTDEELDALIQKASRQFSKYKRSLPDENKCKRDINMQLLDSKMSFDHTPSKSSIEFKPLPSSNEFSKNKRTVRKRRDLNMKRLDYKAKLEDKRQRIEDKKYEMLGNAQDLKNTIKDKMRKLKYVKRLKRDINMDLIKIKADGQKIKPQKETQKKQPKSLFKDKEEKEATIRKPGQTSAELLDELEEENKSVEKVKPAKKVVFAELALPEEDEEDEEEDFFKSNIKPNKHNKHSGTFFDDVNPRKEAKRSKQGRKKDPDDIQFLSTSEEFTDIEEDLPCIHEFFGPRVTENENAKDKNIINELGEIQASDKKAKKKKSEKRKMTELADVGQSEEGSMELLRRKRVAEKCTDDSSEDFDVKCQPGSSGFKLQAKQADANDDANEETINYSESETLESPEDIQGLADNFSEKSLPCSEKNGLSEAEILRYKRANSESEGYKAPLKKSSNRNEVKRDGSDRLRKKRDLRETRSKEKLPDIKKDAQYELKALQQKIIKDKLIFEEEKMKNKIKLLQLKKMQEQECMANERGDIVEQINNIKNEKQNVLQEQLKLLKKKMEQRKKEIDKLLFKDMILHEKLKEERLGMLKDIMHEGKHTVNDAIDLEPRTKQDLNVNKEHTQVETSPIAKVAKRSIISPKSEVFGNYQSLTKNLKTWKPSDILSLKRDVSFMKSPKLKPITDYRISKNGQFNLRRRRSTDTSLNDLENEIDGFMNEIEKDSTTSMEKHDYVQSVPHKDIRKGKDGDVPFESKSKSREDTSDKAEDLRSPTFYTFSGDIGEKIESDLDNTDSTEYIQKVPEKHEQQGFDKFVSNIAGFLTNIGRQLGHYLRHMTNN